MNIEIDETILFDLVARQIANYIHQYRQFQKLPDRIELMKYYNVLVDLQKNHYNHRDMGYIQTSLNFLLTKGGN